MLKTKILKVSMRNIETAAKQLKKGKIVIYPTESSYAIGCDATNLGACKKIFKIKARAETKSLPFIVSDLKTAEKYGALNENDRKLIKKFMPGPLTLIVGKKNNIGACKKQKFQINIGRLINHKFNEAQSLRKLKQSSQKLNKISNTVNKDFVFRISENKYARFLSKKLGKPIVSTSANISGREPVYKIKEILKEFYGKVDIILDSGNLQKRKPSTIVEDGKIIREGAISKKLLSDCLQ